MIGVFVQFNEASRQRNANPVGWVICENGCWEWVGAHAGTGYGYVRVNGAMRGAHRAVYERFRGPIPDGKELDHLCRNVDCVNPDHLEVVTGRENTMRSLSPSAANARKTTCSNGHAFTPENTRRWGGHRYCIACHRDIDHRRWLKRKHR